MKSFSVLTVLFLSVLMLFGCGGGSGDAPAAVVGGNTAPVADAGPDQSVTTGATVTLDGSGSTDADSDTLTYSWTLTSVPSGSSAVLSDPAVVAPTFTADVLGTYVAQLIVNDGTVDSAADTVTITDVAGTVTSATGRVWMDRNLGASQVAESLTDTAAYGDLYQWGRGADGHEKRDSATTATLSSSDVPGHGNFITINTSPNDWRIPQNDNLWQGVSGTNNPCPAGFRLPTYAEWNTERASWVSKNAAGAFASSLKLVSAGDRDRISGTLTSAGSTGLYWSSTASGIYAFSLLFSSGFDDLLSDNRAWGNSVRCLQD